MKKNAKEMIRKFFNIFLVLATVITQSGLVPVALALAPNVHYEVSTLVDKDTSTNLNNKLSGTAADDGKIVTDKTVTKNGSEDFTIELSALGQSVLSTETISTNKLLDVVFILDVSGSMEDKTENGSRRYIEMTKAVNAAMRTISKNNPNHRMGIVTFSDEVNTLLPLASYKTSYTGSDDEKDFIGYKPKIILDPYIKVSNYISRLDGHKVTKSEVDIVGGTYTQIGIQKGSELLINSKNTENRVPLVIMLSDGKPTYYSNVYNNPINESRSGDGSSTNEGHGKYVVGTAANYKAKINGHYQEPCQFYSIGMGISEDDTLAKGILNPTETNVNALLAEKEKTVEHKLGDFLTEMKNNGTEISYADGAYFGEMDATKLKQIFDEIAHKTMTSPSSPVDLIAGSEKTAIKFVDTIGDGMTVFEQPILNYKGKTVAPNSEKTEGKVTTYFYKVNQNLGKYDEVTVTVDRSGKNEVVTLNVPKNAFPYIVREEKTKKGNKLVDPISLSFDVKLSDEASRNAKTGDVFYTNKDAYAEFKPAKDNKYEFAKNSVINKEVNETGTKEFVSKNTVVDGVVTTELGNNGKITLYDPDETTSLTITKKWNDDSNRDRLRPENIYLQLYADGNESGEVVIVSGTGNEWTYTFDGMKKYHNGKEIKYTAKEVTKLGKVIDNNKVKLPNYTVSTDNENANIIVNTHNIETVNVTVNKVWKDDNNRDNSRVPITVVLKGENGAVVGESRVLNERNNWTTVFENLPKYNTNDGTKEKSKIIYTVEEVETLNYDSEVTPMNDNNVIVVTNTIKGYKTTVAVAKKVWEDNDNQDGTRKPIEVQLYKNGKVMEGKTAILNASNSYTHKFDGLDLNYSYQDESGAWKSAPCKYTIEEITQLDDYESSKEGDLTVKNTYTKPYKTRDITVVKVWNDSNNRDGIRPESLTVKLFADGVLKDNVVLNAENNWTHKFDNLPVNSSKFDKEANDYVSSEINYTLTEEVTSDKYQSDEGVWNESKDTFTFTNTYNPLADKKLVVTKKWNDQSNRDGKRPSKIYIQLFKNGKPYDGEIEDYRSKVELSGETDEWTYEFTNLENKYQFTEEGSTKPVTKDNVYTVREVDENGNVLEDNSVHNGYTVSYNDRTNTITNSYEVETTSFTITKKWVDENNISGFRPEKIKVQLYANGEEYHAPFIIDKLRFQESENTWEYVINGLVANENGKPIKYTARELKADGSVIGEGELYGKYKTTYDDETGTITNTYDVEKFTTRITKKWNDNNNQDGLRPACGYVEVQLYRNEVKYGKPIKLLPTDEPNVYMSDDIVLLLNANGEKATYTFKELNVGEEYEAEYDYENFTVTNTHNPYTKTIHLQKKWADNDNQDYIRPDYVKFELLKNGTKIKTVTITEEDNWFKDVLVDVNENGTEADYEIVEIEVAEGYTPLEMEIEPDNIYSITNKHEVEKTQISVNKVWNDGNNADGIRADEIKVQINKNGEAFKEVSLNELNNWKETITGLDKYVFGDEIVYTVSEISKISGYTTSYSEDTYTIVNNHEVLRITKTADKKQADPGEDVTYTIKVSNYGDVDCKDIVVVDKLDENLEFISGDGKYNKENHTVEISLPLLKAKEEIEYTIKAFVKVETKPGVEIKNTAVISGNKKDDDSSEDDDEIKDIPSNEVIVEVVTPPKGEIDDNPDTSDNVNLLFITMITNMLFLGFYLKKRFN